MPAGEDLYRFAEPAYVKPDLTKLYGYVRPEITKFGPIVTNVQVDLSVNGGADAWTDPSQVFMTQSELSLINGSADPLTNFPLAADYVVPSDALFAKLKLNLA